MNYKVTIYSQPGCARCNTIKMLLKKHKIQYIENQDIDTLRALGFEHTPVLIDDGEAYIGDDIYD